MDEQLDMTARLLLLAAVDTLRDGAPTSYVLARLRVRGFEPAQVQHIVDTLAERARNGALESAQVEVAS